MVCTPIFFVLMILRNNLSISEVNFDNKLIIIISRHYSVYHYTNELKAEFGRYGGKCVHCKAIQKGGSFISHMGQVHNEVEKYLPDIAKIPISVQV